MRCLRLVAGAGLLLVSLAGCKQPLQISESQELQIGRSAAQKLEAQQGVWDNATETARVRRLGEAIAKHTSRPGLPWSFKLTNDKQINAMALPGGYVYVTRGLIEAKPSDAKLAGVLGHEIAHVTQRHAVKIMEKALTAQVLVSLATKDSSAGTQQAADIALELVLRKGYREEEYDADRVGTRWAYGSGYPARGLRDFLADLKQREKSSPSQMETWISTHPPTANRITRLEEYLPQLTAGAAPAGSSATR